MPYLGQSPSKGDENNFKILDDISSYTLTFDGSDSSVVSAANDTITSLTHRFVQGQRVTYNNGGGSNIAGLTSGSVYYIIKHDHHNIKLATSASNASNGTAVNITNVGGGASHTINVAFDGVNTKFKATHTNGQKAKITRSAQLVISINGVIQQPHDSATPSTGFGFDLDGTIVFSQAPVAGDVYWAHVLTNNNVTFDISDNDVDNFTGDGSKVTFNLSKTPPDNRNVLVTIDGVIQYPNDPDGTVRAYNVIENVLTFVTAPASATEIQVRHIGFAGSSSASGGVTNFYGRTGSVVLKNTDNIVANNAEFAGNLTVQGTMTTLDTKVTEVDQLEVAANNTTVGVAITQSGSGDILKLYDGSSEVFSVATQGDGIGAVTISSPKPRIVFTETNATPDYQIRMNGGIFSIHDSTNDIGRISITSSRTDINNPVLLNNDTVWIGDKLVHWTDDDTAIRFPAANTVTVETGGNERFRIASDGQNTIKSGAHDKGLDILPVGNSQETRLRIQAKNSSGTEHTFSFNAKQSANRMDISGTGPICFIGSQNVGVHNSIPTSPLHVGDDVNPHSTKALLFVGPASGDGQFHLRGGSPTVFFDSTSSGNAKILTDNAALTISDGTIGNDGTELLRITSGGQIGIGNIVPDTWSTGHGLTIGTSQATLWGVGDQVNLSGNAYFNSGWKAAATKAGASQIQQALGNIDFRVTGSINADAAITWTEAVRITPAGVIGINDTNPGTGKKVKVVVADNSSYQMAVNLTNNVNADINFYIKTSESLIAPSTNTPLLLGTGGGEKLRITSDGFIGINKADPKTGLTINKFGTQPVTNGNTYPYPAGNWSTVWNTTTANSTDYWCGFVGGYNVSSATVNISLAPNHLNLSNQAGVYIAGEATSTSTTDFTVGKINSGSATGSSVSAGNQRATKGELFRIRSDGGVGIGTNNNFNGSTLSIYGADIGEGTAKGQLVIKDTAAYDASPTAGIIFQGIHAAGSQAIFAGIRGFKENATNGNYAGALAFDVRAHGAVAYEALRITSAGRVGVGTITPHTSYRFDIRHTSDSILHLGQNNNTLAGMGNDSWNAVSFQGTNCELGLYKDGSGNYSYIMGTYQGSINIPLIFRTGNRSERLRITPGGDVTTTGTSTFNRQNAGFTARAGDSVSITRANGTPLEINRTGNDGQMISLLDDNTQEAAIAISGGSLQFGTPNSSNPRLTITSGGNVGINDINPNAKLTVIQDGLSDNLYKMAYSYRSGNNASGYTASGLGLYGTADNSNGDKHTTYLYFGSRDPSLNGSHGAGAWVTMSNPDSQGSYGTGQLDFYIRNGSAYSFPNDPQAPSSYWMESLFRIESNGRVKVPGELRVDRIVPDGGLPSGSFGGIIQIRWSANVDNANYSSTSDVTMQTVNITPQRTSSRMLIHVVYPSIRSYTTGNTRNRLNQHIKRDGTEIYTLSEMPQWRGANFASSNVEINHNVAFTHIDHPNTTNQVSYTATWQSVDGHVWNTASGEMVMIVAELTG